VPEKEVRENPFMFDFNPDTYKFKRQLFEGKWDRQQNKVALKVYITKPTYSPGVMVNNPFFLPESPHKKIIYGRGDRNRKFQKVLRTKIAPNVPRISEKRNLLKNIKYLDTEKPTLPNLIKYLKEEENKKFILIENDLESMINM